MRLYVYTDNLSGRKNDSATTEGARNNKRELPVLCILPHWRGLMSAENRAAGRNIRH